MPKTTTIKGSGIKDKPVDIIIIIAIINIIIIIIIIIINFHYYYCCCCYYYEKVGCKKESYFLEFMNVNVAKGFCYCVNNENVLESDWFLTAHLIA